MKTGSSLIPVARIREMVPFQGHDNTRKIGSSLFSVAGKPRLGRGLEFGYSVFMPWRKTGRLGGNFVISPALSSGLGMT